MVFLWYSPFKTSTTIIPQEKQTIFKKA